MVYVNQLTVKQIFKLSAITLFLISGAVFSKFVSASDSEHQKSHYIGVFDGETVNVYGVVLVWAF